MLKVKTWNDLSDLLLRVVNFVDAIGANASVVRSIEKAADFISAEFGDTLIGKEKPKKKVDVPKKLLLSTKFLGRVSDFRRATGKAAEKADTSDLFVPTIELLSIASAEGSDAYMAAYLVIAIEMSAVTVRCASIDEKLLKLMNNALKASIHVDQPRDLSREVRAILDNPQEFVPGWKKQSEKKRLIEIMDELEIGEGRLKKRATLKDVKNLLVLLAKEKGDEGRLITLEEGK